ncbi:MAG: hypothetical protein GY801_16545 [bacterium]|nr:hypothetical protein [bacterium]
MVEIWRSETDSNGIERLCWKYSPAKRDGKNPLYERFTAEWLKLHLPPGFSLQAQEKVMYDEQHIRHLDIDLVLSNSTTDEMWVLDTKYKAPKEPSRADIYQVTTYAVAKNCRNAVLIYPTPLQKPIDTLIGGSNICVRSMTFALDGDLEQAGQKFLDDLLGKYS